MKLYEIRSQYLDLLNRIENGDIPEDAITDTLESLDCDFDEKINNIACYIKALEGEISLIYKEVDNLRQRAENKAKKADRLKQYIFESMKAVHKPKIETAQNVISIKKNPPKVDCGEEFIMWAKANNLKKLLIETVISKPDKQVIKEELLNGKEIPYCRIVQEDKLSIK